MQIGKLTIFLVVLSCFSSAHGQTITAFSLPSFGPVPMHPTTATIDEINTKLVLSNNHELAIASWMKVTSDIKQTIRLGIDISQVRAVRLKVNGEEQKVSYKPLNCQNESLKTNRCVGMFSIPITKFKPVIISTHLIASAQPAKALSSIYNESLQIKGSSKNYFSSKKDIDYSHVVGFITKDLKRWKGDIAKLCIELRSYKGLQVLQSLSPLGWLQKDSTSLMWLYNHTNSKFTYPDIVVQFSTSPTQPSTNYTIKDFVHPFYYWVHQMNTQQFSHHSDFLKTVREILSYAPMKVPGPNGKAQLASTWSMYISYLFKYNPLKARQEMPKAMKAITSLQQDAILQGYNDNHYQQVISSLKQIEYALSHANIQCTLWD